MPSQILFLSPPALVPCQRGSGGGGGGGGGGEGSTIKIAANGFDGEWSSLGGLTGGGLVGAAPIVEPQGFCAIGRGGGIGPRAAAQQQLLLVVSHQGPEDGGHVRQGGVVVEEPMAWSLVPGPEQHRRTAAVVDDLSNKCTLCVDPGPPVSSWYQKDGLLRAVGTEDASMQRTRRRGPRGGVGGLDSNERRKERNRRAQRNFRSRQKDLITGLHKKVKELRQDLEKLQTQQASLKETNQMYKSRMKGLGNPKY